MMRNPRFTRATELLLLLAASGERANTSATLAKSLGCHAVEVRRLLLLLQRGGLAASQKGPGGGARLKRPAKQITLAEVWKAVGAEPRKPKEGKAAVAEHHRTVVESAMQRAERALLKEMQGVSLQRLLKRAEKIHGIVP
jgi:Rrf2 family protein